MPFVELGGLYVGVQFGVLCIVSVTLLVGTLFIFRFVKGIFQMEHRIMLKQSSAVEVISEYTPPSDLMATLRSDSDAKKNTEDRKENNYRMALF